MTFLTFMPTLSRSAVTSLGEAGTRQARWGSFVGVAMPVQCGRTVRSPAPQALVAVAAAAVVAVEGDGEAVMLGWNGLLVRCSVGEGLFCIVRRWSECGSSLDGKPSGGDSEACKPPEGRQGLGCRGAAGASIGCLRAEWRVECDAAFPCVSMSRPRHAWAVSTPGLCSTPRSPARRLA